MAKKPSPPLVHAELDGVDLSFRRMSYHSDALPPPPVNFAHRRRMHCLSRSPPSPDKLHPTLSSWLKNMNKLSGLIDRLQELASSAPEKHRSQLSRQVATLRATFKKQQERCVEFLELSEEYATRYLLDISAEIQQQSSFLDMLEKRLDMATTLHRRVIDLRRSHESGIVNTMKDVCATGKAASCHR